jgi:hypothetical protein
MKHKLFVVIILVCFIIAGRASGQTVTLDYYFNHETRIAKDGQTKRFHYMWDDTANTGFSIWGEILRSHGARLDTLDTAPTFLNLNGTAVYVIVDPDSKKENPSPNYVTPSDADNIAQWVKTGGVLVLMANDSANVELPHFNILAAKFGMYFNNDMQNHVINDAHFEDGAIEISNNPIFKTARKVFLKDVCSINLNDKCLPVLKAKNGATIAAIAKYGKGTVFAVTDPWLYNEYVNGRLPAGFDNDRAAVDLTIYLLSQANPKK